jgi:hypothetical protein
MAYLKPPAFTRKLANPLAMRLNAHGGATLTVVGRRTGEPRRVPVIPVELGGTRYLVSPYGGTQIAGSNSRWGCRLKTGDRTITRRDCFRVGIPGDPGRQGAL